MSAGRGEDTPFDSRPRRRASRRRDQGAEAVADLLVPTLARLGHKTRARHLLLIRAWPEVVGEAVAAHATPSAYARGRLTVDSDSPAMGHQLRLQKQLIIDGLNQRLGEVVVRDLHFRLGGPETFH